MLTWKRAVKDTLPTCQRRTWVSHCGRYKVEEHTGRLGGEPDLYMALAFGGSKPRFEPWLDGEARMTTTAYMVISSHRTKAAAVKACERHSKRRARHA